MSPHRARTSPLRASSQSGPGLVVSVDGIVCVRACASPSLPFGARHSRCASSEAARSLLGVEVVGSGEERVLGWGPSEGSIRSFSGLLASKNELCTSVQRAFVYLRKPLCRRKPGTCRPGWLASRARTVSTAASGPHPQNWPPPLLPPLPPPPPSRKPSSVPDLGACPPGDVMTRGEGTCVSSEGTCACARASLLACAKHGASSTTVYKKRWRVFIINEFLDIRFTHPRQ